MKTHLPPTLRSALLACMTVFSPLSITVASTTLVAAIAVAPATAADSAYYAGGDLSWGDGSDAFTSAAGDALSFNNGMDVIFSTGATDAVLAGQIVTDSITLNSAASLTLTGGEYSLDAGEILLEGSSSLSLTDDLLRGSSVISVGSSINATISFDASDSQTVFNYGSVLKDYQGHLVLNSGHLYLQNEGGFVFNDISLTGNDASITFASNTTFDRLMVPDNNANFSAQVNVRDGVHVIVSNGAHREWTGSYSRGINSASGSQAGYTINLGQGSLLSDNVRIWQGRNPINVIGQGRYEVSSLLIGYTGISETISFNVGAGATFAIIGGKDVDGATNSFALGGASKITAEMNVEGTFIINSQIARVNSVKSVVNVKDGGLFVLNAGFKSYDKLGDSSSFLIDVAEGGALQVGNQESEFDYSTVMSVLMATNTSLAGNGVDAETVIHHSIQYAQGGTHTLKALAGDTLTMNSAVNNAGTLNITGGGTVQLANSNGNDIKTLSVAGQSSLLLKDGVSLFSTGGSLNVGTGSSLDMTLGSTSIKGNVNLSNQSQLIYHQGVAGATIGTGNKLTLANGAGIVVGFDDKLVGSFEQILFTGLSASQLAGFGLTESYYNGMLGCDASDFISEDASWFLAEGSVVYLDDAGNLVLNVLAHEAYWNGTGDESWSSTNQNWLVDGMDNVYTASRQLIFGADAGLNKDISVEGSVSTSTMEVLGDYSFSGGSIAINYSLSIGAGAHVAMNSNLSLNDADLVIGDNASLSLKNTDFSVLVENDRFFNDASNPLFNLGENASLSMSGGNLIIGAEGALDISKFNGTIIVLTEEGKLTVDGVNIDFAGGAFDKYFSNIYVEDGAIKGEINRKAYNGMAHTKNGLAGLNMMSNVLIDLNPQWTDAAARSVSGDSSLAAVLDTLDAYQSAGQSAAADVLGAAIAGASTTVLSSALMGDVQRQLNSIRNRTQSMGVDPSLVNQGMPYFNAWISAEGGSTRLSSDGTLAGYSLTSVGGSIGVDVDLTEKFSIGLAYSALRGDLSADSIDYSSGDMDTMYGSLYARLNHNRWSHSFVASFGTADATLKRSIATSNGYVSATGKTSGSAMGLMYEVGYTFALAEDASSCIQPLFNISYLKSQMDAYSETGSDIALHVGEQSINAISIGAGALYETIIGEDVYNRASVFSARAMLKYDAGDRASEADVTLIANDGVRETVKGAEYGAMGVELGLGLSIPVTEDSGILFIDASCELRSGQNSFSGTVGYRFAF